MSLAKGRYLCWLHQDDAWHPDRLNYLKQWLAKWPGAQLFLHGSQFMDGAGRVIGSWRRSFLSGRTSFQPDELIEHLLVQNFIAASAAAFRTDAVSRLGGLDQELWYCADWDFWLKLASSGQTVYCGVPLTSFRIHACSQTLTCPSRVDDVQREYAKVLDRYLPRLEGRLPNADRIVRIARFSAECNLGMMRFLSGQRVGWFRLASRFLALGPRGWRIFLRDSRILERVISRLRAGLTIRPRHSTG
jgi:GT2 family glycosyltransferase